MIDSYKTTHHHGDVNPTFPFVVTKNSDANIYADPTWGLFIAKVTIDGNDVMAKKIDIDLDHLNFNKIAIGDEPFIYLLRKNSLITAESFDETKGEYSLLIFELPEDSRTIVIQYQLRDSRGTGPLKKLESTLI